MNSARSVYARRRAKWIALAAALPLMQFGGCVTVLDEIVADALSIALVDGFAAVAATGLQFLSEVLL
ncbi:MAG: hypothetical protein V3W34_20105 [Phycisphaerae bacterium]